MEGTASLKIFLKRLLLCSEKAANIARCCRAEKEVFALLIQEKSSDQKNNRFWQDFKTLADVLVQETIKHDLVKEFPVLDGHIYGEESNMFTNQLGESVCVQVAETEKETSSLLSQVLDENHRVADLLAEIVFQNAELQDQEEAISMVEGDIDLTNVGIWIDPIDATFEYIHGNYEGPNVSSICESGLQCALVLIGAYDLRSGIPIAGVLNQPFKEWLATEGRWNGKPYWGICVNNTSLTSLTQGEKTAIIVTSSSECSNLTPKLQKEFKVIYAAGAGYKALLVALGLVDAYVLSKGTTYLWDTCGPQALLNASGGGLVSFEKALRAENVQECLKDLQLVYNIDSESAVGIEKCRNKDGIIAYRDIETLENILNLIRQS